MVSFFNSSQRRGDRKLLKTRCCRHFSTTSHIMQSHQLNHFNLKAHRPQEVNKIGISPIRRMEKSRSESTCLYRVISCWRGESERGAGSVPHVPSSRPCGQLWRGWPSHLAEAHRAHSQSGKSWSKATTQLCPSFLCFYTGLGSKQWCQWLQMSLAAGKQALLTTLEASSSCSA